MQLSQRYFNEIENPLFKLNLSKINRKKMKEIADQFYLVPKVILENS